LTAAASLLLNTPYAAPTRHWQPGDGGALVEAAGRRPASYQIFDIRNNTRRSESLDRDNEIRGRVDAWRAVGYPGATAISRRLLEHWYDATALASWVQAVNAKGGFGAWCWDVVFDPVQIQDILNHHAG
jgi:type III restriction enzyme